MSDLILWLDLETTGLDPQRDLILEVGLVVSNGLEEIIDSTSIVMDHGAVHLPPEVLNMHLESGLLSDIGKRGVTPSEAWVKATVFLEDYFLGDEPQIVVGGSGIDRFDLPFLRAASEPLRYLADRFHFRTVDVSGLKYLMGRNGIPVLAPSTAHRAVDDAKWAYELACSAVNLMGYGQHMLGEVPA